MEKTLKVTITNLKIIISHGQLQNFTIKVNMRVIKYGIDGQVFGLFPPQFHSIFYFFFLRHQSLFTDLIDISQLKFHVNLFDISESDYYYLN